MMNPTFLPARVGVRCLVLLAGAVLSAAWGAAGAQNLIANPGFENNPPPNYGNNIGWPINPWTLGTGQTSNVVKVNGQATPGQPGYYGNGGPRWDADPATNIPGQVQHYLDIASGANDFYQSFLVPTCGAAPGQTRQATFSGWFSTRDNLSGGGAIRIREGQGLSGNLLAEQTVSLPAPASSMNADWVQVTGTVTVQAGSWVSYVVTMDNNLNFDEAYLAFDNVQCVTSELTLRKTWTNASVGDSATVAAIRNGAIVDSLVSVANSPNETDTDGTPITAYEGEVIELSEVLAAANVGIYDTSLACTGGGTLAGNQLTIGNDGQAIACTYTNAGRTADLSITKTSNASTVPAGSAVTYDIVVRNDGTRHANNATVQDPLVTGLSCTSVTCTADTPGAACPGPPPLDVAVLQNAGLVVPALPAGGQVTFTLSCTATP